VTITGRTKGVVVSNPPEVFLGLVTHSQSFFNQKGQSVRSFEQLVQGMKDSGMSVDYLVSDQNDYSTKTFPISRIALIEAAQAQAKLEHQWRVFIAKRSGLDGKRVSEQFLYYGMRLKRTLAGLKGNDSPAAKAYQRLINIDLSHHRVLTQGINSGAKAVVVLEDDALLPDPQGIGNLIEVVKMAIEAKIDFINLSESISVPELGIERILNRANPVACDSDLRVIELDAPVTNTVCANYYSREFAITFHSHISPDRLTPVKPIDWRLNEVMLENPRTTCWWVQPGFFVQGSMH
jgi:hypothetical protein